MKTASHGVLCEECFDWCLTEWRKLPHKLRGPKLTEAIADWAIINAGGVEPCDPAFDRKAAKALRSALLLALEVGEVACMPTKTKSQKPTYPQMVLAARRALEDAGKLPRTKGGRGLYLAASNGKACQMKERA